MGPELLDIQPRELKFTFELKKQSSCSVQLVNNSDQYVAFKVKTTSPKKYCVRPNTGVIQPKSTCDFTVTMQGQRAAPPDFLCKDKFLIQSTIVPFGTTEEEIAASMFSKDSGNYIEENKLRVVLISPPHSPVLLPINGAVKQEYDALTFRDQVSSGVENLSPHLVARDAEELKLAEDKELKPAKDVEELKLVKDVEELKLAKDVELKLTKDMEELKSKLKELESNLSEAEVTITKLRGERSTTVEDRQALHQELAMLRRKNNVRRVQVGFPVLFVCLVGLVGLALGYMLRT